MQCRPLSILLTSASICKDSDESTHSFVLALNDDYEQGGTYFMDHNATIRTPLGCALSFCGDQLQHGGQAVTSGTRYILAVFLYYDDDGYCSKVQSTGTKRLFNDTNRVIQESKQQKAEFSFDFSL